MIKNITVIGAGAWGSALAMKALKSGLDVTLVAENEKQIIHLTNHNHYALPNIKLPPQIHLSLDVCQKCEGIIIAIPAQKIKTYATHLRDLVHDQKLSPTTPIILASKGIDLDHGELPILILRKLIPNPVMILSGPNYALEIAAHQPAVACLGYENIALASEVALALSSKDFKVHPVTDAIGMQVVGSFKNIIAICCGIAVGKKWGENIQAAFLLQGIKEMEVLIHYYGGCIQTVKTHAGISDLVLTSFGHLSRNKALGIAIGEEKTTQEWIQEKGTLAEGYFSLNALMNKGCLDPIQMPLTCSLYNILFKGYKTDTLLNEFLLCCE